MKYIPISLLALALLSGCTSTSSVKTNPLQGLKGEVVASGIKAEKRTGTIVEIVPNPQQFVIHFKPDDEEKIEEIEVFPFDEKLIANYVGKRVSYTDVSSILSQAIKMMSSEQNGQNLQIVSLQRIDSFKLIDE